MSPSLISLFSVAAALIKCSAIPKVSSPLGPVVNLGYAAFVGNSTSPTGEIDSPVTFFGGIPYARPPLGDLRFRAPVPLDEAIVDERSLAITDARNWGPPCIQQPAQVGIGSEGQNSTPLETPRQLLTCHEDCLTLNVWKPTDAKEGDKLPVIVYIHVSRRPPLNAPTTNDPT